jgi:hypothetical protein
MLTQVGANQFWTTDPEHLNNWYCLNIPMGRGLDIFAKKTGGYRNVGNDK